ncbi:MAG: hypothetical protein KGS61_09180 [Verrucomicrobia bacterium]|nr:hypothetical protein [Verrucomicrobiota bacterium]
MHSQLDSSTAAEPDRPPPVYWLIPLLVAGLRAMPYLATRWVAPLPGLTIPPVGYNPTDFFAYAGFVHQSAVTGHWLLLNPFTTAAQQARYFLPLFSLLGELCRWTGWEVFQVLEWARVPLVFLFFGVLWRFLRPLLPDPRQRLIAGCLVGFSGGMDGLVLFTAPFWPARLQTVLLESLSHDQGWSTFASMNNPLWVAGLILTLVAVRPLLLPQGTQRPRDWLQFGLGFLAAFFVHPYSGLAVLGVALGLPAVRWVIGLQLDRRRYLLGAGAALVPALGVIALVARWQDQDEVFRRTTQRLLGDYQLSIFWYPITFGGLGVLAARGWRLWLRTAAPCRIEVGAWIASVVFLHTSSLFNGYHFVFQLHLPLCILAAGALDDLLRHWPTDPPGTRLWAALGLAVVFQSPLVLTWRSVNQAVAFQVPVEVMRAVARISRERPGKVYTSSEIGEVLPAYSSHRVYVGHWFLTPDYLTKRNYFIALREGRADPGGLVELVQREGIDYVLLPPAMPAPVVDALRPRAKRVETTEGFTLLFMR